MSSAASLASALRQACFLAEQVTTNSDDTYIGIRMRSYGFLVEAKKEINEETMRHDNQQVMWEAILGPETNDALLLAVERAVAWAAGTVE